MLKEREAELSITDQKPSESKARSKSAKRREDLWPPLPAEEHPGADKSLHSRYMTYQGKKNYMRDRLLHGFQHSELESLTEEDLHLMMQQQGMTFSDG